MVETNFLRVRVLNMPNPAVDEATSFHFELSEGSLECFYEALHCLWFARDLQVVNVFNKNAGTVSSRSKHYNLTGSPSDTVSSRSEQRQSTLSLGVESLLESAK